MEIDGTNTQAREIEQAESEALPSPPAWGAWEWIFLFSGLLAAGCYFFAHFPHLFTENGHFPGIGLTLTQWLLTAVFLAAAKKRHRLRGKSAVGGWFLLAAALALGACFTLFASDALRLMNLPVAGLSTVLALFSLTGANPLPALTGRGLRLGLRRFLPALFARWLLPLKALKNLQRPGSREGLRGLGAGLLLGLPAVILAASLLASADRVFGSWIQLGFLSLDRLDASALPRLLFTLMGGLCLFSLLSGAVGTPFIPGEPKEHRASPVTLSTVLAMLAAVYALFVYIQFRYLFFGSAEAVREIGYAEYARSGFFQLVLLAVLTLTLILPCLSLGRESGAVRLLCAFVAALTMVIDFSAFFRMRLYIQAYGLSVLRAATLWGMLMILCALTACMVKCVSPGVQVCPALTVLALCTWTALNLCNVDRLIARYQVNGYNQGSLASLDVSYLASLSPDVMPELERVQDETARLEAVDKARRILSRRFPVPYDWSLSWLNFDRAPMEKALVLAVNLQTAESVYALSADFSQGGLLCSQACRNAKERLPLEGTVYFTLDAEDLPGLDVNAPFSIRLHIKNAPEDALGAEENDFVPVTGVLSVRFGEECRAALTGSRESGYALEVQTPDAASATNPATVTRVETERTEETKAR